MPNSIWKKIEESVSSTGSTHEPLNPPEQPSGPESTDQPPPFPQDPALLRPTRSRPASPQLTPVNIESPKSDPESSDQTPPVAPEPTPEDTSLGDLLRRVDSVRENLLTPTPSRPASPQLTPSVEPPWSSFPQPIAPPAPPAPEVTKVPGTNPKSPQPIGSRPPLPRSRPPTIFLPESSKMPETKKRLPKPGPAKLSKTGKNDRHEWLKCAFNNQYLPEATMKELCEICKVLLMEESNIQPVSTPVTVCGDLHGQFYDVIELFRVAGGAPSDVQAEPSPAPAGVITSADIEPPTEITNPKLKKKLRSKDKVDENSKDSSGISDDEGGEEEEQRGRKRESSHGSTLGDEKEGNSAGIPGNQNYIFLGDFVDRGYFSLETLTLLLCLKACYPSRVTLVRGNHESRQITQVYGFYEECQTKYGNPSVWKACCQVFDFLVLGAVIDGKVLCVHGGLSPEIRTLDQIRVIARAQEIPHEGAFCDLVWSDPEDVGTWAVSPRGAGWLFGNKVATEFNHVNGFQLIARAHQLVNEGYKWHFEDKSVVTVWSAPNYCYRCGNVASIMNLGEDLDPNFQIFSAVSERDRHVPPETRRRTEYFL